MNRHPFRWDAAAFGLFFLAMLGQWAVWEQDLLTPDDLAYVAATVISGRPERRTAPFTPTTHETTDESETP